MLFLPPQNHLWIGVQQAVCLTSRNGNKLREGIVRSMGWELRGRILGFINTELFPECPCYPFSLPIAGQAPGGHHAGDSRGRASCYGSILSFQSQPGSSSRLVLSPPTTAITHHCEAESHPSFKVPVKAPFSLLAIPDREEDHLTCCPSKESSSWKWSRLGGSLVFPKTGGTSTCLDVGDQKIDALLGGVR